MRRESGDLTLERWGLRFRSRAVEADYRRWRVLHAMPLTRAGMVASLIAWALVAAGFYVGIPEHFAAAAATVLLLIVPVNVSAFGATYVRALQRWAMPLTMLAVTIGGLLAVWLSAGIIGSPGVAAGGVAVAVNFAFTIFRLSPTAALVATTPYVVVTLYIVEMSFATGRIGQDELTGFIVIPLIAEATGLVVCAALERIVRETYRNERIIARQQQALIEERANLSKFLAPEVTNMVRERGIEATLAQNSLAITAVCCDLRGFTAYTEHHGASRMAAVLREYYGEVVDVARRYGGTVNAFAGDGALILVGAPLGRPDHAQVGLDLARELVRTVADLTARFSTADVPLGVGAGVATGVCAVGAIGSQNRLEYTAIGAAVNLAARLCEHAGHGELLISPDTVRAAQRGGPWREERLQLKGFDKAVTASVELCGTSREPVGPAL